MKHSYNTRITWTGNSGSGTSAYSAYERSHTIDIEYKPTIAASSDKAFRGDATKHNPEDLFLSSIAGCHMLWYLHLCADQGIVVESYVDQASGIMETAADGSGKFVRIVLRPAVVLNDKSKAAAALALHKKAHQLCFLANSVNFDILIEPEIN